MSSPKMKGTLQGKPRWEKSKDRTAYHRQSSWRDVRPKQKICSKQPTSSRWNQPSYTCPVPGVRWILLQRTPSAVREKEMTRRILHQLMFIVFLNGAMGKSRLMIKWLSLAFQIINCFRFIRLIENSTKYSKRMIPTLISWKIVLKIILS
jgi:hypothetical protein